MLAVIVVMLVLALVAMTAAAPYVITQIKREREDELIHRGHAYANAIKRFYKRMGRYPTSLGELENANRMRFIRKLYKDPMSKSGDWRIIHYGEAKYFPKGFGYNNISGIGGGTGGAILPGGMSTVLGTGGATTQSGQNSSSSLFSTNTQSAQAGQANQPNTSGMTPADQISKPLGSGPTLGNLPIIGVASTNPDLSIHEVNERKHYNEWEFFYDPRFDLVTQLTVGGATPAGQLGGAQTGGGFGQSGQQKR